MLRLSYLELVRISMRQGQAVLSEEDRRAEKDDLACVRAFDPSMLESVSASPWADRLVNMAMSEVGARVDVLPALAEGWMLNRAAVPPGDGGGIALEGCFSQERSYAGANVEAPVKSGHGG